MEFNDIVNAIGALSGLVAVIRYLIRHQHDLMRVIALPGTTHSLSHEIGIVLPFAVALNLVGGALAIVGSGVFLDMVGTFVAAMVLGPWWAALAGLVSNVLIGMLPFTTDLDFYPFAMVQVAGAVFWGYATRCRAVGRLLSSEDSNVGFYMAGVLILGAGGGVVTGLSSTWVNQIYLARAPLEVVGQSLIDGTGPFYGIVAVEIAGKVSTVVIGTLMLRTMFPLFGRAATHGVSHSGLLPVLGLLVASVFYGFKLVEPEFRSVSDIDRGMLFASGWILILPVLGFLDELHWTTGERRRTIEMSPERLEIYKQLEEVVRPSDRVFSFVSLVAILVAFVLAFLLESGQGRSESTLLPKLLPIVALFLLVAWSLEVSARHNRLDERLADGSSIGAASDSDTRM